MKIALLGYGKEGQAAEKYFKAKFQNTIFDIFENETPAQLQQRDYSSYDIILRSPSIPPLGLKNESTLTRYFFDHCPCPIIGVTATKGKGTTCSFIKSLLDAEGQDAYLIGNIGTPAIEILDQLKPTSVVVYEMSSFQLWDLKKSPHVAVIGTIEPDHLNVHKDYDDYKAAKANIGRYQTSDDYLVYYQNNPESVALAEISPAQKVPYPFEIPAAVEAAIKIPGRHNLENSIAAIAAVASYHNLPPSQYINQNTPVITQGLSDFRGLPHRLEFVREIDGTKFYDDNFSTNPASTKVAIEAFPGSNLTVIIGGRDKTDYQDLPEIYEILQAPQIKNIILIGESGQELGKRYQDSRFISASSLEEAVQAAKDAAHASASTNSENIVLMSPAAASFDMFENVYDRGDKYQKLLK